MKSVSVIRLVTYAIILAIFLLARKERYFIPLDLRLPDAVHPFREWDPSDQRFGGYVPTLLPGFGDTRLSGREILRIAEERMRDDGVHISE